MSFFGPEDFRSEKLLKFSPEHIFQFAAELANDKLEREGKVVFFADRNATSTWHRNSDAPGVTHRALLINIEPIEQCDHSPEKLYKVIHTRIPGAHIYQCECGKVFVEQK